MSKREQELNHISMDQLKNSLKEIGVWDVEGNWDELADRLIEHIEDKHFLPDGKIQELQNSAIWIIYNRLKDWEEKDERKKSKDKDKIFRELTLEEFRVNMKRELESLPIVLKYYKKPVAVVSEYMGNG